MEDANFAAFEAEIARNQAEAKRLKKEKKKEKKDKKKKKKKKDKKDDAQGQKRPREEEAAPVERVRPAGLEWMMGGGGGGGDDVGGLLGAVDVERSRDRRAREREEEERARDARLASRIISPNPMSALAAARQSAVSGKQTLEMPTSFPPPPPSSSVSHVEAEEQKTGARGVAAMLRAKLRGETVAEVSSRSEDVGGGGGVRVVNDVDEEGRPVVLPRGVVMAGKDSLVAMAAIEKGLLGGGGGGKKGMMDMLTAIGEEYGVDGEEGMVAVAKKGGKKREEKEKQREKQRAQGEAASLERRVDSMERRLAQCRQCWDGSRFWREGLISAGRVTALCSVWQRGVHALECELMPKHHVSSWRDADEGCLQELDAFRGCVVAMLRQVRNKSSNQQGHGMECIWIEDYRINNTNDVHHALMRCVPIARHSISEVEGRLKLALEEGEDAGWADGCRWIPTWGKRVHKCVPEGFSYIHFEWNRDVERGADPSSLETMPQVLGGMCLVIPDAKTVPRTLVKEILGSFYGLDRLQMKTMGENETTEQRTKRVEQFKQLFFKFDWTREENL